MGILLWIFDCGACARNEVRQASEPKLRYVRGRDGVVASIECCDDCAAKFDKMKKEDEARAKKAQERKRAKAATGGGAAGA